MPGLPIALTARDPRPPLVLLIVLLTRALIAWEWATVQALSLGDIPYYWSRTASLGEVGLASTMREYPTPMVGLLAVPQWLGGGSEWGYAVWFVTLMVLADLSFCGVVWATRTAWRGWGIVIWSVLCAALGPLVWLRFDLLPAVLVGVALVIAAHRPASAGGLLAVGAGTKLWPAVLFPLLLNRPDGVRHRDWFSATLGFGVTGVVVVVASVVAGGWARLVSPLVWQSDRGLQIESLPATVLMVARAADPATWQVRMSRYQAFELFGPGVDQWLAIADALAVVGIVLALAVLVRHWRRPYATRADWATGAAVATLAILCLLIVTNKTLSPQYVIWLGGPIAALVAGRRLGVLGSAVPLARWIIWLLLTAATTHLVYPVLYDLLNGLASDPVGTPRATVVLVLRNALLVAFTVDVLWHALRPSIARPESPASWQSQGGDRQGRSLWVPSSEGLTSDQSR